VRAGKRDASASRRSCRLSRRQRRSAQSASSQAHRIWSPDGLYFPELVPRVTGALVAAFLISHSNHDRETVKRLHGRLRPWGYDSLYLHLDPEYGIAVGQEWEREL